ncbi:ATP-dependent helicase HrpB [Paraferrimonas sp. SM1919]|uniref:ATP-dependent helicase HrpB n=1 Tax=Paraferrimonas sp. SM1919 TaxID=2662263 RepID=UPI0013D4144B|nr:ATP-dependent helicase HrpB [Paraferrimonas sp. SM1919]
MFKVKIINSSVRLGLIYFNLYCIVTDLPITEIFEPLKQALSSHNQILIQAPTGAGKSTALPLMLVIERVVTGKIIMLEPRRIAAKNLALYLAGELGEAVGQQVGYRIKGESKVSNATRLEIVTEGVLTQMIQSDPELTGIDMVIFDEFHERHIATDLGLALVQDVQLGFREDLKMLLVSATLEKQSITELLDDAPMLVSEGRSYPVDIEYAPVPKQQTMLNHCLKQILVALHRFQGSLLVFLPGQGEIKRIAEELQPQLDSNTIVAPLYGNLSPRAQQLAIQAAPSGKRKVVLTTNIAESSLTIDGIKVVIDAGLVRRNQFNPRTGLDKLILAKISKASATQRAGRAGRLSAGHCIRLWSETEQQGLRDHELAEIHRSSLTDVAFELSRWGVANFANMNLPEQPPLAHQNIAWQRLQSLQLTDESGLTKLGQQASALRVRAEHASILTHGRLLEADSPGTLALACILVAILEESHLAKSFNTSDIETLVSQYHKVEQWRTRAKHWFKHTQCQQTQAVSGFSGVLLACSDPLFVAKMRQSGEYLLAKGFGAKLSEGDALSGQPYLYCANLQELEGHSSAMMRLVAQISETQLEQYLGSQFIEGYEFGWQTGKDKFSAKQVTKLGAIVFKQQAAQNCPPELVLPAIAQRLTKGGINELNWSKVATALKHRLAKAANLYPQQKIPAMDDANISAMIVAYIDNYRTDINRWSQVQQLDLYDILMNQLDWQQQQWLAVTLPKTLTLVSGRQAELDYSRDQGVMLSVRMQEMYGCSTSPTIADGKIKVTLELLSPARRPLAITADLANFWQGPYLEVQKQMKGRYPKHPWPDDPQHYQYQPKGRK